MLWRNPVFHFAVKFPLLYLLIILSLSLCLSLGVKFSLKSALSNNSEISISLSSPFLSLLISPFLFLCLSFCVSPSFAHSFRFWHLCSKSSKSQVAICPRSLLRGGSRRGVRCALTNRVTNSKVGSRSYELRVTFFSFEKKKLL